MGGTVEQIAAIKVNSTGHNSSRNKGDLYEK